MKTDFRNIDIVDFDYSNNDFGYRFEVMLADCTEIAADAQDFELAANDFIRNVISEIGTRLPNRDDMANIIYDCNMIINNARMDLGLTSLAA